LKSFRLRSNGTIGLGTPVDTSHLISPTPQGTEIILREGELRRDGTELQEDWRETSSSKLNPGIGAKIGAVEIVLTEPAGLGRV